MDGRLMIINGSDGLIKIHIHLNELRIMIIFEMLSSDIK